MLFLQKASLGKKTLVAIAVSVIAAGGQLAYAADGAVAERAAPQAQAVPNQLIVGVAQDQGFSIANVGATVESVAVQLGGKKQDEMSDGSAVLLEFSSNQAAVQAIETLKRVRGVSFVEQNGIMSIPPQPKIPAKKSNALGGVSANSVGIKTVSNDPVTGYQWHHTVIRDTAAMGTLSTTPPTVAVIDTGVDYTHPDLAGKVLLGKDTIDGDMDPFDEHSHGTHVAGLIAAKSGNAQYGEGVCKNCKILAVRVLDANGSGSDWSVAQGMAYARTYTASPAVKVINMSLGGSYSSLIATQVAAIKTAGKVLVAAAGNENNAFGVSYPGGDPNTALRVMATDETDCRAWFSNFSPTTATTRYNIAAPGWEIPSTIPNAGIASFSGTSMASPIVAGAAALVWGQIPTLTRDGLVTRLLATGKSIDCGFPVAAKRLDVRKAVTGTAETAVIGQAIDPWTGKAPPSSVANTMKLLNGTTLIGSDLTNQTGSYEIKAPAATATRTLTSTRTGYVTGALRSASVVANTVAGPYIDAMNRNRGAGTANISVEWKTSQPVKANAESPASKSGWEFDTVVKTPSGVYIYWKIPGSLTQTPYVGTGVDSIDTLKPVESSAIMSSAANGVYTVFIMNGADTVTGSWNPTWTGSNASVQISFAGAVKATVAPTGAGCATGSNVFWTVGKITKNGTSYAWTPVNTCSATQP